MAGLEYQKKGRILGRSSSSRGLQKRNSNFEVVTSGNELVLDLLSKVSSMVSELENLKREGILSPPATIVSSNKKYTEEEFNEELVKALKKELASFNLKLESKDDKIQGLEFKIKTLLETATSSSTVSVRPPRQEVVKIGKRV